MTHEELLERIKYCITGDLINALEIETDKEIRSLIIQELLSR